MEIHCQPSILFVLPFLFGRTVAEDVRRVEMQVRCMNVRRKVVLDCCWQVEMVKRESGSWFVGPLDERQMVLAMVKYSMKVGAVANEGGDCAHDG